MKKKKISKKVREEAATILSVVALRVGGAGWTTKGFFITDIAGDMGFDGYTGPESELARSAFSFVASKCIAGLNDRLTAAEAESLLRTGWSPS